jgi:hypothetical protein
MGDSMSLQERIEEMDSCILNVKNDLIELTGFTCPERLLDYHETNSDCWFSLEISKVEDYDIAYIKDNALFVILDNNIEVKRYHFIPLERKTIKYKSKKTKSSIADKTYSIRKCSQTGLFNYKDAQQSLLFNTYDEVESFIAKTYPSSKIIREQLRFE